jgi:DNA primase
LREIQNTTESDSDSNLNGEAGDTIEIDGWEAESNPTRSKEERSQEFNRKLIKLANKKASLTNILRSLNISFSNIVYSASGWTHNRVCPFKDHSDRSPSFWFHPEGNKFNCFGCSRGGGPVQFLSIYNGKSQTQVAKELCQTYGDLDDVVDEINEELQEKIDNLILESSDYFKKFMKNHLNNEKLVKFVENLTWSLDVYLEKLDFANSNVEIENLEARINIMKRKLAKFE